MVDKVRYTVCTTLGSLLDIDTGRLFHLNSIGNKDVWPVYTN